MYERPPIVLNKADVLRQSPFKPILEKRFVTIDPFNLHMVTRLQQRKLYDENFGRMTEENKLLVS